MEGRGCNGFCMELVESKRLHDGVVIGPSLLQTMGELREWLGAAWAPEDDACCCGAESSGEPENVLHGLKLLV